MYYGVDQVLGMPWSEDVDTFSAGIVLAELYLGDALFPLAQGDVERLALLERVLGPFPIGMAKRSERKQPGIFKIGHPVKVRFPSDSDAECSARQVMDSHALAVRLHQPPLCAG